MPNLVKLNDGRSMYADKIKLSAMLVEETRKAGHMLTFDEARSIPDLPTPNNYAFSFGSFANAAKEAWNKVEMSKKG